MHPSRSKEERIRSVRRTAVLINTALKILLMLLFILFFWSSENRWILPWPLLIFSALATASLIFVTREACRGNVQKILEEKRRPQEDIRSALRD